MRDSIGKMMIKYMPLYDYHSKRIKIPTSPGLRDFHPDGVSLPHGAPIPIRPLALGSKN